MFVPALVHLVGLPFCTESPKYLYITKDRPDLAEKCNLTRAVGHQEFWTFLTVRSCFIALRKLRGKNSEQLIQNELEQLAAEKEKISKQVKVPYLALITKPSLRRALIVSVVLQAAQQFSGIIAVRSRNLTLLACGQSSGTLSLLC